MIRESAIRVVIRERECDQSAIRVRSECDQSWDQRECDQVRSECDPSAIRVRSECDPSAISYSYDKKLIYALKTADGIEIG